MERMLSEYKPIVPNNWFETDAPNSSTVDAIEILI